MTSQNGHIAVTRHLISVTGVTWKAKGHMAITSITCPSQDSHIEVKSHKPITRQSHDSYAYNNMPIVAHALQGHTIKRFNHVTLKVTLLSHDDISNTKR